MPTRAAFIFIFFTVALDMLALGIVIPVLPKLIVELEGGDLAAAAATVGVFGFSWAAMQFVASPLLGILSDRFGRRPVILLSSLGLALDYVLMALAPGLSWLFVGRLISGVTSASVSTAGAYIADVTPPEERAGKFGMLGAAFGLGFVVGPAVGGLLGEIDLRLPFWVCAGLSFANSLYGVFVLPESLPKDKRTSFSWARANPIGSLKMLRSHGAVLLGLAVSALLMHLAHESLPATFVLYADYRYGWSERDVGLSLAAVGVTSAIVSVILVRPVVARFGERRTFIAGLLFGAVGLAGFGLAPTGLWLLAMIPIEGLWGVSGPALQGLASRIVGPSEQGQLQGALSSLRSVTGMFGPLVFSQVLAYAIGHDGFEFPGAAFLLASALLVASALVAIWVTRATRP